MRVPFRLLRPYCYTASYCTSVTASSSPPPRSSRSFSSTSRRPRMRLSAAASYHGKPGSPAYVPPRAAAADEGEGEYEPSSTNNDGSRPDWRSGSSHSDDGGTSDSSVSSSPSSETYPRLKQGLPPSHPLAQWRDSQLAREPWGAGHDWFFVNTVTATNDDGGGGNGTRVWAGVADGVGGWEDSGVDPSHFAQAVMWHARQQTLNRFDGSPKEALAVAYDGVLSEKGIVAGSSTALIVDVDTKSGKLRAANLGDSTFFILRPGPAPRPSGSSASGSPPPPPQTAFKTVHAQESQTHFFNAPRQLAKFPKGASKRGALVDLPKDADEFEFAIRSGDVIVLATDGFSDNVFPVELEQLVALVHDKFSAASDGDSKETRTKAKMLADVCVNYARICSFKPNKLSPFELEARRYGHHDLKGGKVDDVCVVVIIVEEDAAAAAAAAAASETATVKAKL